MPHRGDIMAKAIKSSKKKTAFVLSGGGSRGAYQIGVWKALTELGWEFDMVVGVSVGSLNGAMVVQNQQYLAENLWRDLETDHIFDVASDAQTADFALEFIKQGGAGSHGLKKFVDSYIDDHVIRESKIDFGLLVVEFPSMTPHYLWKKDIPKGKIGDFVMASSSAFPAIQAYDIDGKKYIDGGFEDVMPIHMAVKKGATDIVAVYLQAIGKFEREKELASAKGLNLTLIEPKWDLGNFLLFDKANTARIMRLGYADAMKAFGVYDGEAYTFIKGEIEKRHLKGAEAAAKIFELDPLILYGKNTLLEHLSHSVSKVNSGAKSIKSALDVLMASITNKDKNTLDLGAFKSANRKLLTVAIAKDIESNGISSVFLNKYALRIAHDEILAARFIQAMELI